MSTSSESYSLLLGLPYCRTAPVLTFPNVTYTDAEQLPLHLVVSAKFNPAQGDLREWRLITNLPEERLRRAPRLYRHRMTPEEVHRDTKHGHFLSGFALSHLGRLRHDRFQRLLFMLSLDYGFLVLVAEAERETRAWLCRRHWGLSLSTFALDLLRKAGSSARRLVQRACATVQFNPAWLENWDS